MLNAADNSARDTFICSRSSDFGWHGNDKVGAFEVWHFDAVSDDGSEALVVKFYDNYPFSPRFPGYGSRPVNAVRVPAVSMVYAVNGKCEMAAINEIPAGGFAPHPETAEIDFGQNSIAFKKADYGSGFLLRADLNTVRGRRITAELEWLAVESDVKAIEEGESAGASRIWNLAVPRGDVSGRISLIGREGKTKRVVHFRGTGYHETFRSERVPERFRYWGRAHFNDSTIIFEHSVSRLGTTSDMYEIRNGEVRHKIMRAAAEKVHRDRFGIRIPTVLALRSEGEFDSEILIKARAAFRTDVGRTKLMGEVAFKNSIGKVSNATALIEITDPRPIQSRILRRIADLRIGRDGRPPIL